MGHGGPPAFAMQCRHQFCRNIVTDMEKKQPLWGIPAGKRKKPPTQVSEGVYRGCISRQDLVPLYSRYAVLSRKKPPIAPFLFLLLTYRYIICILGLWG